MPKIRKTEKGRCITMFNNYPDILSVDDLCEALVIGRNVAYSLLGKGEIKALRQNRVWKIPKEAVVEYVLKGSGLNMKHYSS
jgi:excisionase family DNA binding protein